MIVIHATSAALDGRIIDEDVFGYKSTLNEWILNQMENSDVRIIHIDAKETGKEGYEKALRIAQRKTKEIKGAVRYISSQISKWTEYPKSAKEIKSIQEIKSEADEKAFFEGNKIVDQVAEQRRTRRPRKRDASK